LNGSDESRDIIIVLVLYRLLSITLSNGGFRVKADKEMRVLSRMAGLHCEHSNKKCLTRFLKKLQKLEIDILWAKKLWIRQGAIRSKL